MPTLQDIVTYTDNYLNTSQFSDYCPNGLQVEGRDSVTKIATGVTASLALIEAALEWDADCLLVHHGYFWKNEAAPITGMKKRRLQQLLQADMSLLAYHLPLDAHPIVGNNIQLAQKLGIQPQEPLQKSARQPIGNVGTLAAPTRVEDFIHHCEQILGRKSIHVLANSKQIQRIAWCTGAAQHMIEDAVQQNADLFLTGEISEQTTHVARENDLHFVAAGHHATERYGVMALGEHLANEFELEHRFFDVDNPA
jgi:dinuclear metal center YbgI/SA1388 family protein